MYREERKDAPLAQVRLEAVHRRKKAEEVQLARRLQDLQGVEAAGEGAAADAAAARSANVLAGGLTPATRAR